MSVLAARSSADRNVEPSHDLLLLTSEIVWPRHPRSRGRTGGDSRLLRAVAELPILQSAVERPTLIVGLANDNWERGTPIPAAQQPACHGLGSALPAPKAFGGEPMKRPASMSAAAFLTGLSCADAAALQPAIPTTLIDINELSRRLSVAKGTLYNWVYIPFVKVGCCVRFDYHEVLETLRQYPIIDTSASGRRIN
jgi:hypothetical protein